MYKRIRINNSIRARELHVIDSEGKSLGVLPFEEALKRASEAGLDLIEISPNANPPIAKIMDYGKYRYLQERKSKEKKHGHQSEMRWIQFRPAISMHDLEMKAKKASEFLKEGDKVRIEMKLQGRERYLEKDFLVQRMLRILHFITEECRIVEGPTKGIGGLYMIIERAR